MMSIFIRHLRTLIGTSGYIEIDELRESLADELGQNPEEVINAIIRDVDTDKVCILFHKLVVYAIVSYF